MTKEKSPEELAKEYRDYMRAEFVKKDVEGFEPWYVDSHEYHKYVMRYPSWTETQAHISATISEDEAAKDPEKAKRRLDDLIKLTKVCVTNLKNPSDFDKAPYYINKAAMDWVSLRIG
jgi:hypothetical protein